MKRGNNLLIVFIVLLIFGLSFVSSGLISNIWVKTTGNAIISNCTDTCYSLNYTCGTANICGKLVNCGNCSAGYVCSSGKCLPQNVTIPINCTDTCYSLNYTCGTANICGKLVNCGNCLTGQICSNGKCLSAPTCIDSDGGLNYYIQGTLTYIYGYTSTIVNDKAIVKDYCSGNYINEAYCFTDSSGISQFGWKGVACRYGCSNGACKKLFLIFK